MSDLDWIRKWANYYPEKTAIVDLDTKISYSYKKLHHYSTSIVQYLGKFYKEGDRIAVLAEQSTFMVALAVACQRLGLILVPLNYRLSHGEIVVLLKDCAPSLIIYSELYESKILLSKDSYWCLSQIAFIDECKKEEVSENDLKIKFNIREDLPLFLFYTSGTTSAPKGVLYTNKMLFWNSLNTSMQLELTSRDCTVNVLPPYHTSGWNIFVMPLLHNGGTLYMLKKFEAADVLQALEEYKATVFIGLPTILQMMARDRTFNETDLSSLRYIITGGEFVTKGSIQFWKEKKNVFIRPGYGLTEAGPSLTSLHPDAALEKSDSIGKPNFYVELDIRDAQGNSLEDNKIGELCVSGNIVTSGYWNNSVATKQKIRNGWLYTGDLALRDEDGFYYIKGRIDDMFISGGENIYPQEIEQILNRHPKIEKAIVLPVPHDVWGKVGAAFIKTKEKSLPIEDIEIYLKDKLARYKYPKHYLFIEEFPTTSVGKISRKELLSKLEKTLS